MSKLRRREI